MKREIISTDNAPKAIGPYSQAIKCENTGMMFCSGQVAIDPSTNRFNNGDIKEQTYQVLNNLKAVIEEAGLRLENVCKTTVYLKSMDDYKTVNEIYAEFFGESRPARAAFEVSRLPLDALVEIEAIACY